MFKKIWKGFKWFFTVNDDVTSKANGKLMHSRPDPEQFAHRTTRLEGVTKTVEGEVIVSKEQQEVMSTYDALAKYTRNKANAVEAAKIEQYGPIMLTEAEIKYVLDNCDVGLNRVKFEQAINLALNIQSIKVQNKTLEILDKFAEDK